MMCVMLLNCSVFESSNGGVTKAVDKRPHYLRCPFWEVILYWLRYVGGLISVRCSELRGVRFSEVRNVLILW